MDAKRYAYLKSIYGRELDELEVIMFEAAFGIVETVDKLYKTKGFCLRDKTRTTKDYHQEIRQGFLNKRYEWITSTVGIWDCQTREDVREMFPLPVCFREEIPEKNVYHAERIFENLQKKNYRELNPEIWDVQRVE